MAGFETRSDGRRAAADFSSFAAAMAQAPPRLAVGRMLGRGTYGCVYEVSGDDRAALKILVRPDPTHARELAALRALSTQAYDPAADALVGGEGFCGVPRVLRAGAVATDRGVFPAILMTRLGGARLEQVVARDAPGADAFLEAAFGQSVLVLAALERAGWVHRDINPQHMLLDAEGRFALVDFGMCARLSGGSGGGGGRLSDNVCTRLYKPPEMCAREALFRSFGMPTPHYAPAWAAAHAPPCDVYSLGLAWLSVLFGYEQMPRCVAPDDYREQLVWATRQALARHGPWPAFERALADAPASHEDAQRALSALSADQAPDMPRLAALVARAHELPPAQRTTALESSRACAQRLWERLGAPILAMTHYDPALRPRASRLAAELGLAPLPALQRAAAEWARAHLAPAPAEPEPFAEVEWAATDDDTRVQDALFAEALAS